MKKLFTLFILVSAFICLNTRPAKAQVPYVNLLFAGDSSWQSVCSLQDSMDFSFYGTATGYNITDSVLMNISFGDGTDTSYYVILANGTTYFWGDLFHTYSNPGAYSVQFIATGSNGSADTIVDNAVLIATQCGDISGKLYVDANGNCAYDSGETPIQNYVVATYNGQNISYGYSDANGDYYLSVPAGFNYIVTTPYFNTLNVACPASGQYTITSIPAIGKDFGIACNSQVDLTTSIHGNGFRPNTVTTVWLSALNKIISCSPPNATVTIDLDPKLTYSSSSEVPLSISSTQVVFNAGLLTGTTISDFSTSINFLTDPTANIGDTLCLTITVTPTAGDVNPADNVITVCLPVRNSCDPNEKFEKHAGASTATVAPGTELDYTIMFQNLGNDDAYDINVIDNLDANLDLSTLKITGYSFAPSVFITGNTMKFEFKNIHLPAAIVNEPKSHGFVSYKIKPKTNTPLGTAINNTANIYFDFNAPILTNTVTDIINNTVGLNTLSYTNDLVMFPNPASDYFTVKAGINALSTLTIYDVTGRIIISKQEINDNQKISTKNLNAGMYFVSLITKGITQTGKLTIK